MELEGKTALVTGAARGIGAATALALAKSGAAVALSDVLDLEPTAAAIRAMGRAVLALPGDVAEFYQVEQTVQAAIREFDHLDIYVACAAYSERGPFWEVALEGFRRTLDVTMMGPFYGLRACAPHMIERRRGCMLVIGSPHAIVPVPDSMAYNMAKAAVDHMVRTAAAELCRYRVRVNAIHPGWTDTPGERKFYTEAELAERGRGLPWGRLARPDEIARGVVFLASDESDYITGSTLTIDGGINLPGKDAI
jgi:glucose 1-dehydrogenase